MVVVGGQDVAVDDNVLEQARQDRQAYRKRGRIPQSQLLEKTERCKGSADVVGVVYERERVREDLFRRHKVRSHARKGAEAEHRLGAQKWLSVPIFREGQDLPVEGTAELTAAAVR